MALVAGDLQRGRRGRVAVPRGVLLGLVAGLGAGLVAARHVQHADHGVGGALPRLLPRRHQAPVPVVVRHRRDREALEGEYILTIWLTEAFDIERHKLLLLLILAHVISTAGIISDDLMLYNLHSFCFVHRNANGQELV